MKANPDKFLFLLSNKKIRQVDICNENLPNTCCVKTFGDKNCLLLKNA